MELKVYFTVLLFAVSLHIMFQFIYKEFKRKRDVIPSVISILVVNLILLGLIWGWL